MAQKRSKSYFAEQKEVIVAPGHIFPLSWDDLVTTWPDDDCYLVALTERQLNVVHSALSLSYYYKSFWGMTHRSEWQQADFDRWDVISAFLSELEDCLMSGCNVSDLIDAINAQTSAITDALAIVGVLGVGDIRDGLDNWRVQDGSDQTVRNTELSDMATEMATHSGLHTNRNDRLGDINESVGILADRVAPNGSDIWTPLDDSATSFREMVAIHAELLDVERLCCANMTGGQVKPNYQLTSPEHDAKCRAANIIYDEIEYIMEWLQLNDITAVSFVLMSGFVAALAGALVDGPLPFGDAVGLSGGVIASITFLAINLALGEAAFDVDDIVTSLQTNKNDIIQALYDAEDTDGGILAFLDNLSGLTAIEKTFLGFWIVGKLLHLLFMINHNDYNIPDAYTGDYTCVVTDPEGVPPIQDCDPPLPPEAAYVGAGTPVDIFNTDGTIKLSSYTFTSEDLGENHTVDIFLLGCYDITVDNPSRSLIVWASACGEEPGQYQSNTTADGTPHTYRAQQIRLFSSDGSFTVDLDFNVDAPDEFIC